MQRIEATKKWMSSEDVVDGGEHDNWELNVEGDEDDENVDDGELSVDDGDVFENFVRESIGLGGRLEWGTACLSITLGIIGFVNMERAHEELQTLLWDTTVCSRLQWLQEKELPRDVKVIDAVWL